MVARRREWTAGEWRSGWWDGAVRATANALTGGLVGRRSTSPGRAAICRLAVWSLAHRLLSAAAISSTMGSSGRASRNAIHCLQPYVRCGLAAHSQAHIPTECTRLELRCRHSQRLRISASQRNVRNGDAARSHTKPATRPHFGPSCCRRLRKHDDYIHAYKRLLDGLAADDCVSCSCGSLSCTVLLLFHVVPTLWLRRRRRQLNSNPRAVQQAECTMFTERHETDETRQQRGRQALSHAHTSHTRPGSAAHRGGHEAA